MKRLAGESNEMYRIRVFKVRSSNIYDRFIREARKAKRPVGISRQEMREALAEKIGEPCPGCGDKITPKNMSGDHAIPLECGGESNLENLCVMCLACNQRKSVLSMAEFLELMEMVKRWRAESRSNLLMRLRLAGNLLPMMFAKGRKHGKVRSSGSGVEKGQSRFQKPMLAMDWR